jgi:hypothetical protein
VNNGSSAGSQERGDVVKQSVVKLGVQAGEWFVE